MNVHVAGQTVADEHAVPSRAHALPQLHLKYGGICPLRIETARVVEFMAGKRCAWRIERIGCGHQGPHVAMSLGPFGDLYIQSEHAGHGVGLLTHAQGPAQVHEPAAFRVHGHPFLYASRYAPAHGKIGGQLPGHGFRKTAAHVQGMYIRYGLVGQQTELHQLGPGVAQSVEIFLVVEPQRRVAGDPDADR